eukprot:scpid3837/ scgid8426/ 
MHSYKQFVDLYGTEAACTSFRCTVPHTRFPAAGIVAGGVTVELLQAFFYDSPICMDDITVQSVTSLRMQPVIHLHAWPILLSRSITAMDIVNNAAFTVSAWPTY